jgi:DNA mismatch repair ATPase MutS
MFRDHDFDLQQKIPWNEEALIQDLELNTLFNAMSRGDNFLFEVAKKAVLSGLCNDIDTILYRQSILKDCLNNSTIIRDIYNIAVEGIECRKKSYFSIFDKYPSSILYSSRELLQLFMGVLKKMRNFADEHAAKFKSEGFTTLFAMLKKELGDEYFASIQKHLRELEFPRGVLISAELGKCNKGSHYILCKPQNNKQGWLRRFFAPKSPVYTFYIHPRDVSGAKALSELKDRGIHLVANALAQSTDHIISFFNMLRIELAFYICCLNLYEWLTNMEEPVCFPQPAAHGKRIHSFNGLYDVCLVLTMKRKIVGNDMNADNINLVIITGANQGGKSTFLRSIGLSQLMMQCGMFVSAESFCSNICDGIFTHYKREEDSTMKSGKLDEELSRMSDIVDNITSKSLVLFNESFAATNEREGSEIARQIIGTLLEKQIKCFFVTHLYDFAHRYFDKKIGDVIFLRAERQTDGNRTFKIIEGEPLQTSYGEDLYVEIFGNA